jgi:hypothetical protein
MRKRKIIPETEDFCLLGYNPIVVQQPADVSKELTATIFRVMNQANNQ